MIYNENWEALSKAGKEVLEKLDHFEPGTEAYDAILKEAETIYEKLVKLEQLELDEKKFLSNARLEYEKAKEDKKAKWVEAGKDILKGVIAGIGSFVALKLCLGVESEDIILRKKSTGEAMRKAINWKP